MNWEERIQILGLRGSEETSDYSYCCLVSLGNTLDKTKKADAFITRVLTTWSSQMCKVLTPEGWHGGCSFGLGGSASHIPWRMSLLLPTPPQRALSTPRHLCILPTVWLFLVHLTWFMFYRFIYCRYHPHPNMSSERARLALQGFPRPGGSGPFTSNRIQIELILFVFIVFIF